MKRILKYAAFIIVFIVILAYSNGYFTSSTENTSSFSNSPIPVKVRQWSIGDTLMTTTHKIVKVRKVADNSEPHYDSYCEDYIFETDTLLEIQEMEQILKTMNVSEGHRASFRFDNNIYPKGQYASYEKDSLFYIENYPRSLDEANINSLMGDIQRISKSIDEIKITDEFQSWNHAEIAFTNAGIDYMVLVEHCEDYPQLKEDFSALKRRIINKQRKCFPEIRRKYIKWAGSQLRENDIEVYGNNTTITYVSSGFIYNDNVVGAYSAIESTLQQFRFKRANFKWSEYADYTYYNINSKEDSEL